MVHIKVYFLKGNITGGSSEANFVEVTEDNGEFVCYFVLMGGAR